MGVHGLWELLAPVGRRVSVEALGGRKLAIDASIWIIQFMKAMRDDRGDMVRNAHLLGFFRRICKLLYLRIKPVFVFDGGTPALKRRTVIARRRQREQAQFRFRKTAEKLLLNHLRTRKLEEIAGDIGSLPPRTQNQSLGRNKKKGYTDVATEETEQSTEVPTVAETTAGPEAPSPVVASVSYASTYPQGSADALLKASPGNDPTSDNAAVLSVERKQVSDDAMDGAQSMEMPELGTVKDASEDEDEEDEELVYLPAAQGKVDPAVLASLPPSMQLDLLVQMREQLVAENRQKFEKVAKAPSSFSQLQIEAYLKTVAFRREINNVQKVAAGRGLGGVPSARIASQTNREFIFSSSFEGEKPPLMGVNTGNPIIAPKPPEPRSQPPSILLSAILKPSQRANKTTGIGLEKTAPEEADGKSENSVQTYVDENGRTHVSRRRGMGIRMTRDLQWNLYLMKDAEKQHSLGKASDDNIMPTAQRLLSNGDGQHSQKLMNGGMETMFESVPCSFSEGRAATGRDEGSGMKSGNTAGSLQISFEEGHVAMEEDEDDEFFEGLVAGATNVEDISRGVASSLKGQVSDTVNGDHAIPVEGGEAKDDCEVMGHLQKVTADVTHMEEVECEWEDGDKKENSNTFADPQSQTGHVALNNFSLTGDSDAEMALVIQQSLIEHDNNLALQFGGYQESEDTGMSDDSDTGNSDESEVEWEDGSGAVAVSGAGFSVTEAGVAGGFLTEEDIELQEAIRRSLDDVGSWRPPARVGLPQLVIREPTEETVKRCTAVLPEISPRIAEEKQLPSSLNMESEEVFLTRERLRKGKAVFDENVHSQLSEVRIAGSELVGYLPKEMNDVVCKQVEQRVEVKENQLQPIEDASKTILPPTMGANQIQHQVCTTDVAKGDAKDSFLVENSAAGIQHVPQGPCVSGSRSEVLAGNYLDSEVKVDPQLSQDQPPVMQNFATVQQLPVKSLEAHNIDGDGVVEASSGIGQVQPSSNAVQSLATSPLLVRENLEIDEHVVPPFQARPGMSEKGTRDLHPFLIQQLPRALDNDAENLIRDAEEEDLVKDREAMLQHEAELMVEQEALAREEADLQAELEEEQEELWAQIRKEQEMLYDEEAELQAAQRKNERNADSVTGEMFAECQELLEMFGLPYIIAPMEAEAQCAYLDTVHLVDGIVTDDCDVFLFGGRSVYKNIFDDRKYVETYYMKDVESEMGLNREKLIRMALLLGSDYTEGISGIGIVNAIEVVNAFPGEVGLKTFKKWVESPDLSLLGLQGKGTKTKGGHLKQKAQQVGNKEGYAASNGDEMVEDDAIDGITEVGDGDDVGDPDIKALQQEFMEKHRMVSKNWNISASFPSEAVVAAYINPQVDKSTDSFTWGRPDLESLRKFCNERFSWAKDKADELLIPVLKEHDRRETQLRLEAFYSFNQRFAKVRSTRIQKALRGTAGQLSEGLKYTPSSQDDSPPVKKPRKKSKESDLTANTSGVTVVDGEMDPMIGKGRGATASRGQGRTSKGSKKGGIPAFDTVPEEGNGEQSVHLEDAATGQVRGRGRERGKGRGRVRGRGRGRGIRKGAGQSKDLVQNESSSSQSGSDGASEEVLEKPGLLKRKVSKSLPEPRRSSRARTEVKYNLHDSDSGTNSSEGNEDEPPLQRSRDGATNLGASDTYGMDISGPHMESEETHDNIKDGLGLQYAPTGGTSLDSEVPFEGREVSNNDNDENTVKQILEKDTSYLEGGGFCGSEVKEADEAVDVESTRAPDYLIMGGGFCIPEDETDPPLLESIQEDCDMRDDSITCKESDLHSTSVSHTESGLQKVEEDFGMCGINPQVSQSRLYIPGLAQSGANDSNVSIQSNLQGTATPGNPGTNVRTEAASGLGLRAVPFLRRKKHDQKPQC